MIAVTRLGAGLDDTDLTFLFSNPERLWCPSVRPSCSSLNTEGAYRGGKATVE